MTRFKLSYFDASGRAEVPRLILSYVKEDFEDHRFSFEEWPTIKPETPFGMVPVLYIDGNPLCESGAIIRYLANSYGLNGQNTVQQAYIEMITGTLDEVFMKIPYFEKDPVKKAEGIKAAFKDHILPALIKMEAKYKERRSDYLIGDKLSYADITMMNVLNHVEAHDPAYLKDIPYLNQLKDVVKSKDGIKQYITKHPAKGF